MHLNILNNTIVKNLGKDIENKLIEINISSTKLTEFCDVAIQGSTSEILPKLFENI